MLKSYQQLVDGTFIVFPEGIENLKPLTLVTL